MVFMSGIEEFMRENIFNLAINTSSGMIPRVDKSTLSNIVLLFLGRLKAVLNGLMVYIVRQNNIRNVQDCILLFHGD